jgi:hypothetical protein
MFIYDRTTKKQFLLVPEAGTNLFGRDLMTWVGVGLQIKRDKIQASPYHSSVLALPSLEQTFHPFMSINKGTALGVLTQKHGGQCQHVA